MNPIIPVVAAVIRRGDHLLLARRPQEKRHGGLWEFPGGKVMGTETDAEALARELQEELGVKPVRVGIRLYSTREPDSPFEIRFLEVELSGIPAAIEHEELRWVSVPEALALALAPSDRRFLERSGPAGEGTHPGLHS